MPPDALPPDDERADSGDANVVDPDVLAERRAQRAEQAERSAVRRAADAQTLAADLARERARLEAERDAARAEAESAREGADAVKAEARHVQAERDALRGELARVHAERDALRAELERARAARPGAAPEEAAPAPHHENGNGNGAERAAAWAPELRRELALARAAAEQPVRVAPVPPAPSVPSDALGRERALAARRASAPPIAPAARAGDRATPLTELALERERSNRLQAQLERSGTVERELRMRLAALDRAVHERREAERRIESALRRVRVELESGGRLTPREPQSAPRSPEPAGEDVPPDPAGQRTASEGLAPPEPGPTFVPRPALPVAPLALIRPSAVASVAVEPEPEPPAPEPEQPEPEAAAAPAPARAPLPVPDPALLPSAAESAAVPSLDAGRLEAARERLRTEPAAAPRRGAAPSGPPAPWLPAALRALTREDPQAAGRVVAGLLPLQGVVTQRPLRYDLMLAERGCLSVDVGYQGTSVEPRLEPRRRREVAFRVSADDAGLARLLLGRRGLRRRARVRGSRRQLRELRRLVERPFALRDLAGAGVALDPALALLLAARAIEPGATLGHRFTIAHAPLPGGRADAWLRIEGGEPASVLRARPGEPPDATIRCTRGALLPLLAGVAPPPGELALLDGDATLVEHLRGWIAATEFPETPAVS